MDPDSRISTTELRIRIWFQIRVFYFIVWWKVGVGKNSVLFAHVPEPDLHGYGGVEKNSAVFFSHTYQILVEQQWSDKVVKN